MFRIHPESENDHAEVENLLDLAFAPGRMLLGSYRLRDGVDPVPDLSLVVRDEYNTLSGSIRYWPVVIGEKRITALLLGPVAVHPTSQGEGLGKMLITESLSRAAQTGWQRVILIGDAPYYQRFGFSRDLAAGLEFPLPTNPKRLLARALTVGAFDSVSGMVQKP